MSKHQRGFTIIELTIAIAFLSILMMAILSLTLAVGKLYVKGDTNKAINQAGRDFSDVVRRDLLSSGVTRISGPFTQNAGTTSDPLESGRICLDTVTYLWNTAALLNDSSSAAQEATIKMNNQSIKFVRIVNPQTSYCTADSNGKYPMSVDSSDAATEQFTSTGRTYALYTMTFKPIATSGEKGVYEVAYTLGTNEANTTTRDADGNVSCKTDDMVAAAFNYCAVSRFDMIVRLGGGGNE